MKCSNSKSFFIQKFYGIPQILWYGLVRMSKADNNNHYYKIISAPAYTNHEIRVDDVS